MLVDTVHGPDHGSMGQQARAILDPINQLLDHAHRQGWAVFFACDNFQAQDPFFQRSRLKPHALSGTPGAEVVDELHRQPDDTVLPKRRLSAFFGTDLDRRLATQDVQRVVICGVTTIFCVLATALDALSHDLDTVIVEECCAAPKPELHEALLSCYRRSALRPMLQVSTLDAMLRAENHGD
jgi:nicotinamidase-related amidase